MSIESIVELSYLHDTTSDRLDKLRLTLEPYIYNYLIEKYGNYLSDFWNTYRPPKNASRSFVIVERRAHPNFWFILRNIAWANPNMSVYIFCSDENIEYIKALLKDKIVFYTIIILFKGSASREEGKHQYNYVYKNFSFYEAIKSEYILTVQMDTLFRKKIPDTLFCGDYWGSPWAWDPTKPGGGGATIRRITSMITLCKKYNPYKTLELDCAEDCWLSEKLMESSGEYPSFEFRRDHSMENIPAEDPIILHQFWTFADTYTSWNKNDVIAYWTHLLTLDIS